MSRIPPVPTTRITTLLASQRLTQQTQADQLDLFRLQEQISTGLRITLPSQDAPAALRAIGFQQLLGRQGQLESNINSGLLFLGNTDSALGGIASTLNEIRADTLGAVGTVATEQQRQTAIEAINSALDTLVTLGNRQFNGRHIFAGSRVDTPPYTFENGTVAYNGDDQSIRNFSDIGVLFSSNITGQEVFGGISAAIEGQSDLDPSLDSDTLLSSLRGGRGINPNGSLLIGDTTNATSSIVDISSATTVGDVVRLIQNNAPEGSPLDVTVTGDGIQVSLTNGGVLAIGEVGAGTTARELGLLGTGTPSTIVSEDLDPQLLRTTNLDTLLGTRARAVLTSGAGDDNNDIFIEALSNGTNFNDVTIQVVNGGDTGGAVGVVFDDVADTLTISIDGTLETTANDVVAAINAEGSFRAELERGDTSEPANAGTGIVSFASTLTAGGSGETLDLSSGIRVVNGGQTFDISFEADETVEDLLNRLNLSEAGLLAEINEAGTGINIRSRLSGSDFQIGEVNGGSTATQLGIRTYNENSRLRDFNFGVGVPTIEGFDLPTTEGTDFTITGTDGITFDVNLSTIDFADLSTNDAIDAVVQQINDASLVASSDVTATAVVTGNVTTIELTDNFIGVPGDEFIITAATGSLAAEYLGFIPSGESQGATTGSTLTGDDARYTDLTITTNTGQTLGLDLSSVETVGDVLSAINDSAANDDGFGNPLVTARLAAEGNGIELIDNTGAGTFTISTENNSQAAEFLGFVADGEDSVTSTNGTLTSEDRNALETESVFNTLIRLRDALEANDVPAIGRASAQLDLDIERVTFAQADVGVRFQSLQLAESNLAEEQIQVQAALSEEIDVDLVEAISQLLARQVSLEASLRASSSILQLSLIDFI